MNSDWEQVAARIVDALDVQAGELIQLRDLAGRIEVTLEVLLAIERRGATPLLQLLHSPYLSRLLSSTDPAILAHWDDRRHTWLDTTDRLIVLAGTPANFATVPSQARDAWHQAIERLTHDEERRYIPYLLVAVPTTTRAEQLGISLDALDALLVPALSLPADALQQAVARLLMRLEQTQTLTIRSGGDATLELSMLGRTWLSDAGRLPSAGARPPDTQIVMNLPSGAVYTTVVETATQGRLWLPEAADARDVTFTFEGGRIVQINAAEGAGELETLFAQHTGEPRRISHIGIGLNPRVTRMLGWPLVDEHRQGAVIIAFGENRYLGGQNSSSLNIDFVIPNAALYIDQQMIVSNGQLVDELEEEDG